MEEEVKSEDKSGDEQDSRSPRVQISPHPLGGIAVLARDAQGNTLATRIDLPEATILVSHLQALITMSFESMYAQAFQAQQTSSSIIKPPGVN